MATEYRVVKVLDVKRIVINAGSNQGISKNDGFFVYGQDPNDIIDPITGENLGKLEFPRGYGRPLHIQDNLTTLIACSSTTAKNRMKVTISIDVAEEFRKAAEKDYVRIL
jgi:hypothetical protein